MTTIEADVEVGGQVIDLEPPDREPCKHDTNVLVDSLVAFIKDDLGATAEWQLRIRAECGECNTKFVIHPNGRVPKDGGLGVVVALAPHEITEPDLSVFTSTPTEEEPSNG